MADTSQPQTKKEVLGLITNNNKLMNQVTTLKSRNEDLEVVKDKTIDILKSIRAGDPLFKKASDLLSEIKKFDKKNSK